MDELLKSVVADVNACSVLESLICGKGLPKPPKQRTRRGGRGLRPTNAGATGGDFEFDAHATVRKAVKRCREVRAIRQGPDKEPIDDETLSKYARFTDDTALQPFAPFLHYVPRLVNVVTLAEAFPVPGTGLKLPLDLNFIASRCTGAYFAPKRFSAVQLAYTHPRARVLVFHTGRLVGTGTSGAMAARLAIARAQRQLSMEAGVHLQTRNFAIINQVGACSLSATLECNQFANAHPHDSHYDQQSFVGLAWRPAGEQICCEVYSTGRANLPGSVTERQLNESWARMLPELLRFSSRSRLLDVIPEELKAVHRTSECGIHTTRQASVKKPSELLEGWVTNTEGVVDAMSGEEAEEAEYDDEYNKEDPGDLDDSALAALGL